MRHRARFKKLIEHNAELSCRAESPTRKRTPGNRPSHEPEMTNAVSFSEMLCGALPKRRRIGLLLVRSEKIIRPRPYVYPVDQHSESFERQTG